MQPVVFQCRRSGNFVTMKLEGDIAAMRQHEGYLEMTPDLQVIPKEPEKPAAPVMVVPKRGRTRKG